MRSRPLLVLAIVALLALLPVAPVGAASDAPNTCAGATVAKSLNTWIADAIEPSGDVDWFRFTTVSNRYALITLGKLAAKYRLDLYSTCGGVAIASSSRSGVQYEEIYKSLAAGTYYVRVSGIAGAHSVTNYQVRFKSLAEGVLLLSYRTWTDSGKLFGVGELLNNTAQTRKWVKALIKFYDASNQQLGSTYFTYSYIDLMKPRTRSPAWGRPWYVPIPAGYHHHTVTADPGTVTDNVPVGNLKVTPGTPYDTSWNRHYPGTLTNNNGFALTDAEVVVTLYNSSGGVVNAARDYPTTPIAAGATVDFDIMVWDHYSGVNRYVFQAEGE